VKAVQFEKIGGPEVLKLVDIPKPDVRPGMVLIRNHAAGLNFADNFFIRNEYAIKPRLPDIPGMEGSGVVEEVGDGVTAIKPGMRVAAISQKTYAEYILASAKFVFPLPEKLSFAEGASFPIQTLTAWHMLYTCEKVKTGQTVVVHSAAGGVGIVAVQIAKAAGARVIGTVSQDSKAALVKQYGADEVLNYETQDFSAEVMRITNKRGADIILDAVGKPTFEKGVKCLAPLGHLIIYGRGSGMPDPFNVGRLMEKSTKISGFVLPVVYGTDLMQAGVDASLKLIQEGKLKMVVGKTYPLGEAAEALRFLASRGSTGKLVLEA
jgi:NADPH2:quinone reductase